MVISIVLMPYNVFYWLIGALAGSIFTYYLCDLKETISTAPAAFRATKEMLGEFWLFNGESSPDGMTKVLATAACLIEGAMILLLLLWGIPSDQLQVMSDLLLCFVLSGIISLCLGIFNWWLLALFVLNGEDEKEPMRMFTTKLDKDTRYVGFPDDYSTFGLYFARGFAHFFARSLVMICWAVPLCILLLLPYAVLWFLKILAQKIYSHRRMGAATGTFIGILLAIFISPEGFSAVQKIFMGAACSAIAGGVIVKLPLNKLAEGIEWVIDFDNLGKLFPQSA